MKIGHCQLQATEDFAINLEKFRRGLEWASAERVEIVSFPECFLNGYYDQEKPARRTAFSVDSAKMDKVREIAGHFGATVIVGFNELRGGDLYNTVMIAERGQPLSFYSKVFAYHKFHQRGTELPVFERRGLKFGVVICADGGYIEPVRILALKGARVVFSPHANYISPDYLINHFESVRSDHIARAVENGVWFLRGNDVSLGKNPMVSYEGIGYGESYLLDYYGEVVVRSRRHMEDYIAAEIPDQPAPAEAQLRHRSLASAQKYGDLLRETVAGVSKK